MRVCIGPPGPHFWHTTCNVRDRRRVATAASLVDWLWAEVQVMEVRGVVVGLVSISLHLRQGISCNNWILQLIVSIVRCIVSGAPSHNVTGRPILFPRDRRYLAQASIRFIAGVAWPAIIR